MAKIEKSIDINAPPEKIFPLLLWERSPEWYEPFKKVTHKSGVKDAVGEIVHVSGVVAGVKAEWDGETTEVVSNEKVTWRTVGGAFTGFGSNLLIPTKTGTKVSVVFDYDMPYSVLGKLMDKLRFQKAFEKSFDVGLKKMKEIAEK